MLYFFGVAHVGEKTYVRFTPVRFDTPQREGHTAVHKAAEKGNAQVARWVLTAAHAAGACDLAMACGADTAGRHPHDIAAATGFVELADELRALSPPS